MTSITLKNEERQRCERWTRVVGYHRPVDSFNKGKQSEHKDRLYFKETKAMTHCCSSKKVA